MSKALVKRGLWLWGICAILGLLIFFSDTERVWAEEAGLIYVQTVIDGKTVYTEHPALMNAENKVLVPLDAVARHLCCVFYWSRDGKTLVLREQKHFFRFFRDRPLVYKDLRPIFSRGKTILIDERLYAPARLLALTFDWQTEFDEEHKIINFTSNDYIAPSRKKSDSSNSQLPILMYHELGDGPNSLFVAKESFVAQMEYLYEHDYRVVSFSEAVRILESGEDTEKVVALTFDDGYKTFYTIAWPILKRYGFGATVFVCPDLMWQGNYMNMEEIRILAANGIEIGSHTNKHLSLPTLGEQQLREEVEGSKTYLETELQRPVKTFCYPAGKYNRQVVAAVEAGGYQAATTVEFRKASPQDEVFLMPRIRISRWLGMREFVRYL